MKTHHALPIEMRGCFAEIEKNNRRSQFVELQYFYFDLEKYNYLKQIDCLEDSIMWKFRYNGQKCCFFWVYSF